MEITNYLSINVLNIREIKKRRIIIILHMQYTSKREVTCSEDKILVFF